MNDAERTAFMKGGMTVLEKCSDGDWTGVLQKRNTIEGNAQRPMAPPALSVGVLNAGA